MKRLLLALVVGLLCMQLTSIVVETGSLSGFVYGTEPNSEYDDWLSHVSEGIASANYNLYAPFDRQTNGFGDYSTPTSTQLTNWTNIVELFVAQLYEDAEVAIASAGFPYQVVQFNDTDTGRTYYMLRENLAMQYSDNNGTTDTYDDVVGSFAKGWGLYIMYPAASRPVIVTVPHPTDDFSTVPIGVEAFKLWDAKYILFSGAGREVRWTNVPPFNNSKSLSDPTRVSAHPYNKAYQAFADDIRDTFDVREFSAQIHSYDWNRHVGMANTQISAGNQKYCPNLPIRDLSRLQSDLIMKGDHIMIPANTFGIHRDVYHTDYYSVFYETYPFLFSDGINEYPVNNQITLPAYAQNQQMLYTLSGWTDYDTYDPFFHIEMDELPNQYEETENNYKWFYGWDEANGRWDYSRTHELYIQYYWRWVSDLNDLMDEMFAMDDQSSPLNPTELVLTNAMLNSVTLSWTRSDDYDFDSYEVLYATEPIGESNFSVYGRGSNQLLASPHTTSITVPGLSNQNTYYFKLRAKDKNGAYSDLTNEVSTTLAPSNISGFAAYGMDNSVRLYWTASGQSTNQGYKIYRRGSGGWEMLDSWLSNPILGPSFSSYEWWDNTALNGEIYTYKISSTNTGNTEYIHNVPMEASPSPIHTITIRNASGTATNDVSFGTNVYASDGQDVYWDTTKSNPSGSGWVWNALWEQYWGNSGTQLNREIKGDYELDNELKSWVMRVRSDLTGQSLYIEASDTFGREEKLYLQDSGNGAWHDLSSGPYTFSVSNSNVRTMNLFWGNLQPKATVSSQPNRVYQGGTSNIFSWSYTYPFLISDVDVWIEGDTDSLLVAENLSSVNVNTNYNFPILTDLKSCKLVIYVTAIDGVVSRFESPYTFAVVPQMSFVQNDAGWKTRTNPWPEAILNITDVFGAGSTAYTIDDGSLIESTDYLYGSSYWVHNPDIAFYSNVSSVQRDEISMDLMEGWNFVPNPHLVAYNVKDLRFSINSTLFRMAEMTAQELVSPAIYVYRNNQYILTDLIEPYEAFLIKFNGSQDMNPQINFYPYFSAPSLEPVDTNWQLGLELTCSNGSKDQIVVGRNNLSTDAYDYYYDLPKPKLLPDELAFIKLVMTGGFPERSLSTEYGDDFEGEGEQVKTWNFRVWAPSTDPLSFNIIPEGLQDNWTVDVYLGGLGYHLNQSTLFEHSPTEAGWIDGSIVIRNYPVSNQDDVLPAMSQLVNYPNPFNPTTTISFNTTAVSPVSVKIYNIKGQLVKTLHRGELAPGRHELIWDGRDNSNRSVASGVYFTKIVSPSFTKVHKMMLLK
ncbi:MAG: FlgD immunoglobulin-like domain containing protein [Candidatus Cloacimonadota bacterium]